MQSGEELNIRLSYLLILQVKSEGEFVSLISELVVKLCQLLLVKTIVFSLDFNPQLLKILKFLQAAFFF